MNPLDGKAQKTIVISPSGRLALCFRLYRNPGGIGVPLCATSEYSRCHPRYVVLRASDQKIVDLHGKNRNPAPA